MFVYIILQLVVFFFYNGPYGDPHADVVDAGYDFSVCGPVEPHQSHLHDTLSVMNGNQPNAYEMPMSSSKNKKKEWPGERNPAKRKTKSLQFNS